MLKNKNFLLQVNKLKNRYVTDGNVWTVDTTEFNDTQNAFIVINLKTKAILGYILSSKSIQDDYILELYKTILDNYPLKNQNPIIIHSDLAEEYNTDQIQKYLDKENIQISLSLSDKHQNQVSESVNDKIKYYTIFNILSSKKKPRTVRDLITSQPDKFKGKSSKTRARDKDYRKWFFNTLFFRGQAFQSIESGIQIYNQQDLVKGMTRKEAEYYNTKIEGIPVDQVQLIKSTDDFANNLKRLSVKSLFSVKDQLSSIIKDPNSHVEEKLMLIQSLILKNQESTNSILIQGFTLVANQNSELIEGNDYLKDMVEHLEKQIAILLDEIKRLKSQEEARIARKEARATRRRLPKRDPITDDIYSFLIQTVEGLDYKSARLRIALCLLTVTGVRISELLPLKVSQLQTLIKNHWIAIDRVKRGPANHKAFLTYKGKSLIKDRQRDFEIIFSMKENDSYIFTSEKNHNKMLRRETLTKDVNSVTRNASQRLSDAPNITSHSFRVGFITQLWNDTKDIEFVRQAIGHTKIESTSSYVENLPDPERKVRMANIQKPQDLIIEDREVDDWIIED